MIFKQAARLIRSYFYVRKWFSRSNNACVTVNYPIDRLATFDECLKLPFFGELSINRFEKPKTAFFYIHKY
jgi:hypothetical protein